MFVDQGLMSWFSALIMAWQFKRILSDKPMFSYIKSKWVIQRKMKLQS